MLLKSQKVEKKLTIIISNNSKRFQTPKILGNSIYSIIYCFFFNASFTQNIDQ